MAEVAAIRSRSASIRAHLQGLIENRPDLNKVGDRTHDTRGSAQGIEGEWRQAHDIN